MLQFLGLAIGVVVILAGATSVVAPDPFLSLLRSMMTPAGLYAITVARVAVGLVFVFGAPASRAPRLLRALGIVVIIAGMATPLFGVARSVAVLDWWAGVGPALKTLDAVVAIALGGFLVYVFRPQGSRRA